MVDVSFPTGTRDEDWLIFSGKVKVDLSQGQEVDVVPKEDETIQIRMRREDVYETIDSEGTEYVFIRRGSQYISFNVVPGSKFPQRPILPNRSSGSCPQGSQCVGGVEFCCGSNVAQQNCYGRWRCRAFSGTP